MSYHDLSSSSLTARERVEEKNRIMKMLDGIDGFTPVEEKFIGQIENSDFVSVKQLFWLRDLTEKYL